MNDVIQHDSANTWDTLVRENDGHPLQLWGWGDVKAAHGWSVTRVQVGQGGAQLLIKALPGPLGPLVYVPRGPFGSLLLDESARRQLIAHVKKTYKPTLLMVEPDTVGPLRWPTWRKSTNRVLLARTAVMDLTKPEDELLANMSKKTRQYIRKSEGEGLTFAPAQSRDDIDRCLTIYKQTAERAGFGLHGDNYYHDIFENLRDASPVFMAMHNENVVAFLWPIITPSVAFELYGGMNEQGQALRANYFLKWSVIREMKSRGVRRYDVNGLLNDGVTTFKKGFIPDETEMSGAYDYPMSPLYPLYSRAVPMAKTVLQKLR